MTVTLHSKEHSEATSRMTVTLQRGCTCSGFSMAPVDRFQRDLSAFEGAGRVRSLFCRPSAATLGCLTSVIVEGNVVP